MHNIIDLNECDDVEKQLKDWVREIEESENVIFLMDYLKEYGKVTILDLENDKSISVKNCRAATQNMSNNYSKLIKQILDIKSSKQTKEAYNKKKQNRAVKSSEDGIAMITADPADKKNQLGQKSKSWIKEAFIQIKSKNQSVIVTREMILDCMKRDIEKDENHTAKLYGKIKRAICSDDEFDLEDILS